jgi:anti-sigma factor RsiW
MTADPYARLDAAYQLGALDADEHLSYEAHLVTCRRCRVSLAEISAIAPPLAGLDESVFAIPPEAAPTPVPTPCCPACCRPPDENEPVAAGSALQVTHPGPESHVHHLFRTADR